MLTILSITAPIYLIIAGGFLAVRFGFFEKRDTRILGLFVANFCLPALLFRALSSRPLAEILNAAYLAAYACGSLAVLLGVTLLFRRVRGQPMPAAVLKGLGMSSSNSAYIGYPIASQLLGPPAAVALALVMIVENLLMVPTALAIAERAERGTRSFQSFAQSLRGMLRNPMLMAIALGFAVSVFDLEVPEVIARTVQIVAAAASPTALFVIGGTLVGLQLEGMRRDVTMITAGKLVLHPLAVGALAFLLPIDDSLRAAAVVFASVPMLSIYPVLAQRYHLEGVSAAALLVTTTVSFVTISGWLWLLHTLGWIA